MDLITNFKKSNGYWDSVKNILYEKPSLSAKIEICQDDIHPICEEKEKEIYRIRIPLCFHLFHHGNGVYRIYLIYSYDLNTSASNNIIDTEIKAMLKKQFLNLCQLAKTDTILNSFYEPINPFPCQDSEDHYKDQVSEIYKKLYCFLEFLHH